ncbi:MerR family transcriptional regulator [uncultured Thermomonospora sp.]|uniref:MerR family transcriptional regulator n=1 Tax=uncultured Thermomonospora sp. TaxID=671175 RepID=UPI00259AF72A|nr:MerR family transcriptional regulator [uncultured Thermomonospora sp.]
MNASKLADAAGITYRQLDNWCRSGYLNPHGGEGTGKARDFPPGEVQVAILMGRLVHAGFTPEAAHTVARLHKPGQPMKLDDGITLTIDL